jgi:hypothetical protein
MNDADESVGPALSDGQSRPRRGPSGGLIYGSSHRLPATPRAAARRASGGGGRVHRTRVHAP